MANVRNANTIFIDTASDSGNTSVGTTGNFDIPNIKITGIVITSTGANATLVLKDVKTGATKIRVSLATSTESKQFLFEVDPLVFPNGIAPTTLTNAEVTLIVKETRG